MKNLEQYQTFDDQHDRMTGLVNAAGDSEDRAKGVLEKANKINAKIKEVDESVSNLKKFASESIREIIDNGKSILFFIALC